jgi:hypothetical protein
MTPMNCSSLTLRCAVACALLLATFALAPAAEPPPNEDEHTRLVQEYMAKRAEWVALREREMPKIKAAKDKAQRRSLERKLDEDVQRLKAQSAEFSARVRAAEKAKRDRKSPAK